MANEDFLIVKASGDKVLFSEEKLRSSLKRSGADDKIISQILTLVKDELYDGITTKELYNRAYSFLRRNKPVLASKYKLKKAIYELGPTGFPFERFLGAVLTYSGYKIQVGKTVTGKCVSHEIDVISEKNGSIIIIECKFHGEQGRNCNVKIPLYIYSRYQDIKNSGFKDISNIKEPDECWVVTNTRFTKDAKIYGNCMGLYLLSWDYPKGDGLKDRIDRLGLYPITVSTLLTKREKQFLLSRDVVLCRQLLKDSFYLDHLGVSDIRKTKILNEVGKLCNI
ncbi:MAG: ATP cone domain-containing protein [Eudoraea sp.]|uniref:ATP cone domain-containing protein n=1 Tax=Eudoraea sp. TaxID=1979955 RepID=UPI003C76F6FA